MAEYGGRAIMARWRLDELWLVETEGGVMKVEGERWRVQLLCTERGRGIWFTVAVFVKAGWCWWKKTEPEESVMKGDWWLYDRDGREYWWRCREVNYLGLFYCIVFSFFWGGFSSLLYLCGLNRFYISILSLLHISNLSYIGKWSEIGRETWTQAVSCFIVFIYANFVLLNLCKY